MIYNYIYSESFFFTLKVLEVAPKVNVKELEVSLGFTKGIPCVSLTFYLAPNVLAFVKVIVLESKTVYEYVWDV